MEETILSKSKGIKKQRKRVKVLLALTVSIVIIFGLLLVIGYAGKQIQDTATGTADSLFAIIFGWISVNQYSLFVILFFGLFALIFIDSIWPSPSPNIGGY